MSENERIKELRKSLKLSQEEFGEAIGLTKSSISNIEKGVRNVTDQHIKLLVSAFNVNDHWLRTGEGGETNIFVQPATFSLDEEAKKNNLSELEIAIMRSYMSLDRAARDKLMDEIEAHFKKKYGIETAATTETAASIERTPEQIAREEAENYYHEVLAEQKGQMLSASAKPHGKLG